MLKKGFAAAVLPALLSSVVAGYPILSEGEAIGATPVVFAKAFGRSSLDVAISAQQTSDGGFIVVGDTYSFASSQNDLLLLKLDSSGSIVWKKRFGGGNVDSARSVQQTSDGGFVVVGRTQSFGAGDPDLLLFKLDSSGNILWKKTFGESNDDEPLSVRQTSDGGFIVAGVTGSFGFGISDLLLLKLDSSGNVAWKRIFRGSKSSAAFSVQQTSDSGFIVAGVTDFSPAASSSGLLLLRLDPSGNIVWKKTFGGGSLDGARSVQQTHDGGFIVAGDTYSFGAGSTDLLLLKLDPSGNIVWKKTFGGSGIDSADSVQQTSDGGFVVAGGTQSFDAGSVDLLLLKLDSSGNILWRKTFGGSNIDSAVSVQQTSDGGFIVAGGTQSFGTGGWDILLLKLDPSGNIPGCSSLQNVSGGTVTDPSLSESSDFSLSTSESDANLQDISSGFTVTVLISLSLTFVNKPLPWPLPDTERGTSPFLCGEGGRGVRLMEALICYPKTFSITEKKSLCRSRSAFGPGRYRSSMKRATCDT
jgi:hypothetical protein